MKATYEVDMLTGVRPTGNLHLGNYVGAIKPFIELQKTGVRSFVFVADLHALTDHEPKEIREFTREVVADYLALGLDPEKNIIYTQSSIGYETTFLMALLARETTVAELLRVPTIKDKLRRGARPETANALLLLYPVMMAADILLHRARRVPVGDDQVAHLEVMRRLARDFNEKYGEVFPIPEPEKLRSLRILSLKGAGKMSKSVPEGSIFLSDDPKKIEKKIKTAETATEGKMTPSLESHMILAKELAQNKNTLIEIDELINAHLAGKQVMGDFKKLLADLISDFLIRFQERRATVIKEPGYIEDILRSGATVARESAEKTLALVRRATSF
jgi:tryptophanyl-tRNA synthetase